MIRNSLLMCVVVTIATCMSPALCMSRPPESGEVWEIAHAESGDVLSRLRFISCDSSNRELVRPYYISEHSLTFGELDRLDSALATALKSRLGGRQLAGTFPFQSSLTSGHPAFELSTADVASLVKLLSDHANHSKRGRPLEVVEISIPTHAEWIHAISTGQAKKWPAWDDLKGRSDEEAVQFIGRGKQLWKELKLDGEYVATEEQVFLLCQEAALNPEVDESSARKVLHFHLKRAGLTDRDDLGVTVNTEHREWFRTVSNVWRNRWGITSGFDQPYFLAVKGAQKTGLSYWRQISETSQDGGFGALLICGFPSDATDRPSGGKTRVRRGMVASGPEIKGGQENFGTEGEPIPIDVTRAKALTEEDYQLGARFVAYRRIAPTYVTTLREQMESCADELSLQRALAKFDEAKSWLSDFPMGEIGENLKAEEAVVEVEWYRSLAICKARPDARSQEIGKLKATVSSRVNEDAMQFFGLFSQRFSP
jgi:hypothetical protein